jgi:hypothetical protein
MIYAGLRSESVRRSGSPCGRSTDEVEAATWSAAGTLDWWVKERQQGGWGGYAVLTDVNAGSKPLIFVLHRRERI